MTSTSHALEIPLILTNIFTYLSCQSHLLSCTLVSRNFFSAAIPILWRRPRIYKPRFFSAFTSALQPSTNAHTLRSYRTYVHELDVAYLIRQRRSDQHALLVTCLPLLPNLASVDLRDCSILTDDALAILAEACPHLKTLWLNINTAITTQGAIDSIPRFAKLRTLHVDGAPWCTDEFIECIFGSCRLLRALNITGCRRVTGDSLRLVRSTQLRSLVLRQVGCMTREQVAEIMACRTLEEVELVVEGDWDLWALIEDPSPPPESDAISELSDSSLRVRTISAVSSRRTLRKLSLNLAKGARESSLVALLDRLGSSDALVDLNLHLWRPSETTATLDGIASHCHALRRLRLERWDGDCTGNEALRRILESCSKIEVLHLCESSFTDGGLEAVVEVCGGRLRELTIEDVLVTDAGVARVVRECTGLRALVVKYCQVTDAPLRELKACGSGMKRLSFECESVGEEAWRSVCEGCPQLEFLELWTIAEVPKEHLHLIAHLRHLETLICYGLGALPEAILLLLARWLPSLRDLIVQKSTRWDEWLGPWLNSGEVQRHQPTMLSIGLQYQEWVRREEGIHVEFEGNIAGGVGPYVREEVIRGMPLCTVLSMYSRS
ncbi:hypothetical protein BC938DRAFT_471918 [Jimgerdemannia flammicorona]|uniref:F-box domain-containing protein n=1 Tax=Jimgerdemannia flammicorona TaxID=994334 RepID=A0A433QUC2_9FUNG|nr:hypothetical protein BC938DRAFT_471918 [Jimgerdemannia flammicorona]